MDVPAVEALGVPPAADDSAEEVLGAPHSPVAASSTAELASSRLQVGLAY